MRWAAATVLLGVLVSACSRADEPVSSPTPSITPLPTQASSAPEPTVTTDPTTSPSPDASIAPTTTLRLPADAPTTFSEPRKPSQFARSEYVELAPPGATVASAAMLTTPNSPFDQIALIWRRGDDPFAMEQGLVVWRRYAEAPAWRAIRAFTNRPAKGVLGITLESADATGDGIDDLLTFELSGGSGACGTWRVTGSFPDGAPELFRRRTCDTELRIVPAGLELRESVFEPGDAHCCPSALRITRLEWDGVVFIETFSEVRENPS